MLNKTQLIILWIMGILISLAFIRSGIITEEILIESLAFRTGYNFVNWTINDSFSLAINWIRVLGISTLIIGSLSIITFELRKRKSQKETKPASRDKLASRIIAFSLLFIAVALIVIAVKMTVGTPPSSKGTEGISYEEWIKNLAEKEGIAPVSEPEKPSK